jgi:hypothetical protein
MATQEIGVIADKFTAHRDEPFVVFLIGMRVNRALAVRKWLSVAQAMPPMIKVLYEHPEKGFLGGESFFRLFPLATILVSYWRSFEDLERFARSKDDPHLKAWQDFYRTVGLDGSVGIWHETYQIEPGKYEGIYANMPLFGLAAATKQAVPIGKRTEQARARLHQVNHSNNGKPEPLPEAHR